MQGDNDPVDVVEIGEQQLRTGSVHPVKPLAVLAMIDDGELDWKVIAIRADDPRAASLNDVEDVERCWPAPIGTPVLVRDPATGLALQVPCLGFASHPPTWLHFAVN